MLRPLVFCLVLLACVSNQAPDAMAQASQTELLARLATWRSFAPICPDAGGFPSKGDCDDGDMTLFNGLLCTSGEAAACDAVRRSQGADGRFWRSPARVGDNRGNKNSFSRDMSMGVLVYLAYTQDKEAAKAWLSWIDKNRPCVIEKPFGGCWIRGPHRLCRDDTDNRCTITPSLWAAMHRVWTSMGLAPHSLMTLYKDVDILAAPLASFTDTGYPMHLVAVRAYLGKLLGHEQPGKELAELIADEQPENPFFLYLRDGATDAVVERTLALCPDAAPDHLHQWSWERDTDEAAWEDSMGWDCVFLGNLLLE